MLLLAIFNRLSVLGKICIIIHKTDKYTVYQISFKLGFNIFFISLMDVALLFNKRGIVECMR